MAADQSPASPRPSARTSPRLPLANDLVFKTLFGRHPRLLTDLVRTLRLDVTPGSAATGRHPQPSLEASALRCLNPDIPPDSIGSKHVLLDILAHDARGTRFVIEMQRYRYRPWPQRQLFYLARAMASQLVEGQDYQHLKPVIGISLLVHDLFQSHRKQAQWHFTLRDHKQHHLTLDPSLQVHIIELHKALKHRGLPIPLHDWIHCLLYSQDDDAMTQITHPPVLEALKVLDGLSTEEGLRHDALRREMAFADERAALDFAWHDGNEQGLSQGIAQGQSSLLTKLIIQKFGPLNDDQLRALEQAAPQQREAWAMRLLDARQLGDVFHD